MQLRTLVFEVKLLGIPQPGKGFYLGSSLIWLSAEVRLAHVLDAFLGGGGHWKACWSLGVTSSCSDSYLSEDQESHSPVPFLLM